MPQAAPIIALSLIGVSITRSQPNFSSKPSLVLKAPPYTPTSSPINTTLGSAAISSNMACLIASRKVTGAMAISSPFRARRISQQAPFSRVFWRLVPSPPQYRRNESARCHSWTNSCPGQTPQCSTPDPPAISAASPPQLAAANSGDSCDTHRRCNRRPPRRAPAAASVNFPQTRAPFPAALKFSPRSLSSRAHPAAFPSSKIVRKGRWDRASPKIPAAPWEHIPPDRAAHVRAAGTFSLQSELARLPHAPARPPPSLRRTPPPHHSHPRCNSKLRTPSRDPQDFQLAPAAAPASNTPKDYSQGSIQTGPSAKPPDSSLREKRPWNFRHPQSRSWPQSSVPGSAPPWPRRSSPE